MKSVRVFILTTEGPVEVQRITPEDPGVQSVICLDGKAVSLPVSPAYEAFVRSPTGVIEACFGHPAYRLDVSGRITEGRSWQLGVFLAHSLYCADILAHGSGDIAVFTTGEVDRDLNVLAVNDVTEKLRQADQRITELLQQGMEVTVFLPRENMPSRHAAVPLVPVSAVADVFAKLGLKAPPVSLPPRTEMPRKRSRSTGLIIFGLAAVTAIAALAYHYALWENKAVAPVAEPVKQLPGVELTTTVIETRAPAGKTCAAVHFNKTRPNIVETVVSNSGRFIDSRLRALCGLVYRITNKGPPVNLTVLGVRSAQGDKTLRAKLFFRGQHIDRAGHVSMTIKALRSDVPIQLQFLLFADMIRDGVSRLPERIDALPEPVTAEYFDALSSERPSEGLSIYRVSHILAP